MGIEFIATSKSADAPDIEGGLYDARFDGVSTKFIEGGAYGDGDRYVWAFTLLDDDGNTLYDKGEPVEVDGLSSLSMNPNSKTQPKALRYFKAIATTAEYDALINGRAVTAESLIGRKVQVDIAIRDNGWPSVVNVLPPRQRRASAGAGS